MEVALDLGVGEVVLTVKHEGGFALWETKEPGYEYDVVHSPWKSNIVDAFVDAAEHAGLKYGFYFSPNANGYLTHIIGANASTFVATQRSMFHYLTTTYSPSRIFFDHYPGECKYNEWCPGGFPEAWSQFTLPASSPILILPGPDGDNAVGGESGVGSYPVWLTCSPSSPLSQCSHYSLNGTVFKPQEADASILPTGDWFWQSNLNGSAWNASTIWTNFFMSWGRGSAAIYNFPPATNGSIPPTYAREAKRFGDAYRASFTTPISTTTTTPFVINCSATASPIEIPTPPSPFNAIKAIEDVTQGQRIAQFSIEASTDNNNTWKTIVNGSSIGYRIVTFLPLQPANSSLRFRCIQAISPQAKLRQIATYFATPPSP